MRDRLVERLQRGADALEADDRAVHVEELADHRKRAARVADHRGCGNLDVREPQDAARHGATPHVVVRLGREAGRVGRDEERGKAAPIRRRRVGAREHVEDVGVEEADRRLLAVQDVDVTAALRVRLHRAHVGAGFSLGQAEAEHEIAGEKARDPARAQLRRRGGEELAVQRRAEAREDAVEVAARHLLGGDAGDDERSLRFAAAPEVVGEGDDAADLLAWIRAGRVAGAVTREELAERKGAQPGAKLVFRGREGEVEHDQVAMKRKANMSDHALRAEIRDLGRRIPETRQDLVGVLAEAWRAAADRAR